jgi:metal-responsive CopG/Arc/MetJ family transcriptional regulator
MYPYEEMRKTVTINLAEELDSKLVEAAKRRHMSKSDIVRQLILDHLAESQQTEEPKEPCHAQ